MAKTARRMLRRQQVLSVSDTDLSAGQQIPNGIQQIVDIGPNEAQAKQGNPQTTALSADDQVCLSTAPHATHDSGTVRIWLRPGEAFVVAAY